eukprot:NODE_40_length_35084_cov_0.543519.p6 type:complete len:484 gc:universal NODE_40_length_35084_cov_0.543519:6546-5095(-)
MFSKTSPDALVASSCLVSSTFITSIKDPDGILIEKPMQLLLTAFDQSKIALKRSSVSNVLLISCFVSFLEVYDFINNEKIEFQFKYDVNEIRVLCEEEVLQVLCKIYFQNNKFLTSPHLNKLEFETRWLKILEFLVKQNLSEKFLCQSFGLLICSMNQNASVSFIVRAIPILSALCEQIGKDNVLFSEDEVLNDFYIFVTNFLVKIPISVRVTYLQSVLKIFEKFSVSPIILMDLFEKCIYNLQLDRSKENFLILLQTGLFMTKTDNSDVLLSKILMALLMNLKSDASINDALPDLKFLFEKIEVDSFSHMIYKKFTNILLAEVSERNILLLMCISSSSSPSLLENKIHQITKYLIKGLEQNSTNQLYSIQALKLVVQKHKVESSLRLIVSSVVTAILKFHEKTHIHKGLFLEECFSFLESLEKKKSLLLLLSIWKKIDAKRNYARIINNYLTESENIKIFKSYIGTLSAEDKQSFQRLIATK